MSNLKIKICGLTRAEDVAAAVHFGADYVGFVLAESKRQITADEILDLSADVPPEVGTVLLFMDQPESLISNAASMIKPDLLQFHGRESNAFCKQFGLPFIKAVAMGDAANDDDAVSEYPDAAGLLYDSHALGQKGGTGTTFDWSRIPEHGQHTWLAGGLNPNNVADAVRQVNPYAVDVSSGIERAHGIKDHSRLEIFIAAARSASL